MFGEIMKKSFKPTCKNNKQFQKSTNQKTKTKKINVWSKIKNECNIVQITWVAVPPLARARANFPVLEPS